MKADGTDHTTADPNAVRAGRADIQQRGRCAAGKPSQASKGRRRAFHRAVGAAKAVRAWAADTGEH